MGGYGGEMEDEVEEELGFSRNYFLAKELGRKSTHKLSDIGLVDERKLREAAFGITPKHEKEIKALLAGYKDLYAGWLFELRCGFNLLMYGFGSKRSLLENFASTSFDDGIIVINGYLHSVNIKQAAVSIAEVFWDLLKSKRRTSTKTSKTENFSYESIEDILSFLDGEYVTDDSFVCVIIHNIDGPGLRDCEAQQYLAQLSACSHVRVIASIDHVNAPLLWNKKMVHTQLNWCWHHVPTFEPYKVEGVFFPMILAGGAAAQNAKTAVIVLQSLTPNAQSVFKVLAEYQLAHPKEEGMPMSKLYNTCREGFIVSSQMTLKSHLTEFKDHELVKTRKHGEGGQECFYIPLPADGLEKLLQELG